MKPRLVAAMSGGRATMTRRVTALKSVILSEMNGEKETS